MAKSINLIIKTALKIFGKDTFRSVQLYTHVKGVTGNIFDFGSAGFLVLCSL